jgi:lipoprotein-releasing system permease protein
MHEFDASFLLLDLPTAAKLFDFGTGVTGLRLRYETPALALTGASALQKTLGAEWVVLDWSQFHRNFFQALQSQKRILFLVLSLIIAVAAFNVVASMVMVVKEKRRDIAILRTQGCSAATVLGAFVVQGLLIGVTGVGLGVVLGLTAAEFANDVMHWLESTFGVDLIKADVYYIDYLPAQVQLGDVLRVSGTTLGICLLATLYPAYRAAQVAPVEALRYD